jgi:hypothetical protein
MEGIVVKGNGQMFGARIMVWNNLAREDIRRLPNHKRGVHRMYDDEVTNLD